jgi:hypothetical protein
MKKLTVLILMSVSVCWVYGQTEQALERLAADTPRKTMEGNSFIAPGGWSVAVRGPATVLEAPEGDSHIVIVDVRAKDADSAVAAAWAAYNKIPSWPLLVANRSADQDGWTDRQTYIYQTSPNERRDVNIDLRRANDMWTATIYVMAQAVGRSALHRWS